MFSRLFPFQVAMSPKMSPTSLLISAGECDILSRVVTHCKHAERLTTPNGKTIVKRWCKMGLKILKDMDGKPRATWYGRVSVKGKKKEGLINLQKAKELGYPQADELIEKYAK